LGGGMNLSKKFLRGQQKKERSGLVNAFGLVRHSESKSFSANFPRSNVPRHQNVQQNHRGRRHGGERFGPPKDAVERMGKQPGGNGALAIPTHQDT